MRSKEGAESSRKDSIQHHYHHLYHLQFDGSSKYQNDIHLHRYRLHRHHLDSRTAAVTAISRQSKVNQQQLDSAIR